MSIRNLIAGVLVAGLVMAQEPAKPPETQPDPNDLIFIQQNVYVMAPVIVRDTRGNIVNGLSPLDFELYDNGKRQEITEDATSHPMSLVVGGPGQREHGETASGSPQNRESVQRACCSARPGEMAVLAYDHRVQVMTQSLLPIRTRFRTPSRTSKAAARPTT